ncbi:hypothetical protein [Terriglobus aquaticus]|uniref:Uncharacterized protein n=1 Tax=Terriglobus aquaticus TaxID=940139 RepID=A0ABW9KQA1_9BACT|nr:hypothetical protein [Terriglobus aquaticus]
MHFFTSFLLAGSLAALPSAGPAAPAFPAGFPVQMASAPQVSTTATGLLSPADLERLLPATVFFSGQSAPLQLRNSAGFRNAAGRMVWAGLVDTSGYSTGVREKYQFYFVTELPLTVGTLTVQPGIYGGGFLSDNNFVLLDVAGNEIGRTAVTEDKELRRPRPLQMTAEGSGFRLYLGRQYATLSPR